MTIREAVSRASMLVVGAVLAASSGVVAGLAAPAAAAAPPGDVVQVAAGARHSCASTGSGAVWCWGDNDRGQLGRDDVTDSAAPVLVEGLPPVAAVDAGGAHSCALTTSGQVWCWGANGSGQLGDGTTQDRFAPVRTLVAGVTSVSTGRSHTCAFAEQLSTEVQLLRISAGGGSYRIAYPGDGTTVTTTGAIPWDADPATVATSLDQLSSGWDVSVWTGSAKGTLAIAFDRGVGAHADIPLLQVDGSQLTGTGAAASIREVSAGAQQLLCWGSDASSQLGRGLVTDADLGLDGPGTAGPASDGANSLAVDPVGGDLFVSDTAGSKALWRFTQDGSFVSTTGLQVNVPTALGVATVPDPGATPRLKVYAATDLTRGPISRYDAARPDMPVDATLNPWADSRVVPPGHGGECSCTISALTVDPDAGTVVAVASGYLGSQDTPYLRLIRMASDLSGVTKVVDYAAAFPTVDDVTDLAAGTDLAGNPVVYALEKPGAGSDWKVAIWDVGGDALSLRTRFSVNPLNRPGNDGAATAQCPRQSTTAPALVSGFWTRVTTSFSFDFGRVGSVFDGAVGVLTKPTAETTLTERYVQDPDAVPQVAGDPAARDGVWVTAPNGGPTDVVDGAQDACVNVFEAGSQTAYGRFVDSYRGNAGNDTTLGRESSDVGATPDGRVLVVDTEHDRLQQFSQDGDVLTRWPNAEYSKYPLPSRPAGAVLAGLGAVITSVGAGDSHTCVSSRDLNGGGPGPVLCWGSNSAGQLGYVENLTAQVPYRAPSRTGDSTSFAVEVKKPPPTPASVPLEAQDLAAASVSAGSDHTCASDAQPTVPGVPATEGSVIYCWGDGQDGQLIASFVKTYGKGTTAATPVAHRLLDTGGAHTCFVESSSDMVRCAGAPGTDIAGSPPLTGASSVSGGARHACAVVAGEAWCWGSDDAGQTGPQGTGGAVPVVVPLLPRVSVTAPGALDAPIVVEFTDAVDELAPEALVVRDSETTVQPTVMTCTAPSGAVTPCDRGPIRTARLRLTGGAVLGETYVVSVHEAGELVAGGRPVPPSLLDVPMPTTVEETGLGPAFSWGTARSPSAYGRSLTVESARGATATYAFRGRSLTWFTTKGPDQGIARVSIDGGRARTVDNSARRDRARVPRTFIRLGSGRHTFTITVAGRPGAKGAGSLVSVDAFEQGSGLTKNPRLTTAWGASSLTPPGDATVTYVAAGSAGSSVSFRCRAQVQVSWRTVIGRDQGQADVYVDGALVQRVDNHVVFGSGPKNRPTSLAIPVSGSGVHEVRIVVVGTGKGGHLVAVDGFTAS